MPKTGAMKHTHKYFRLQLDGLWHCGHPKCTHFMPSNMPEPVWRMSRCWSCGRIIELTPDNMRYTHPTCDTCEPYIPEVLNMPVDDNFTSALEKMMREGRIKKLKEEAEAKERALQSTGEDKPESEDIPLKTEENE